MRNANNDYFKRDFVHTQLLPQTLTITKDTKHGPQGVLYNQSILHLDFSCYNDVKFKAFDVYERIKSSLSEGDRQAKL